MWSVENYKCTSLLLVILTPESLAELWLAAVSYYKVSVMSQSESIVSAAACRAAALHRD